MKKLMMVVWLILLGSTTIYGQIETLIKVGTEFQVNTYTSNEQEVPAVAMNSDGSFVVVWQSDGQDSSNYGILGQRFESNGNKTGSEFQVNTYTGTAQLDPSIAADSNGSFTVVWTTAASSYCRIYGQRFDSSGSKAGSEFQVNTSTADHRTYPSIAMNSNGSFVVVWESSLQDGSGLGIFGQRFDSNGNKTGPEFQVNTYTISNQNVPKIAIHSDGSFIVVWSSIEQDGHQGGVFGQRFDSNGNKLGSEFQVNTYTQWSQTLSDIDIDTNGNFTVVWSGCYGAYGLSLGQRFDINGNKLGSEFQANTSTSDHRVYPSIAMHANGDFIVVWVSSFQDGSGHGIFGQRFDSNGNRIGSELQVNTYTNGDQREPSTAVNSNGSFIVVWQSDGQDGNDWGIFGQRFTTTFTAFFDDFEDANIDAGKWVQVSGSGTVMESDGYLKLNYRSGSPPHAQIRTAYDFMQENVVITVKMKPVYIAGNKNIGFWLGDINTGSVTGYLCKFHSTEAYCFEIVKFHNYDGWGLSVPMTENPGKKWTNSSDFYSLHEAKIIKAGSTYTFYVDGEQIARDTIQSTQPTSLYFSLGRPWMEDRSGEYGEVWLDEITVQSVISYLEAPVLSSPPNGASEVSTSPTLSWNSSSGATSYTLQVSQDSIFSSYVYNQNVGNVTSKQITGLSEETTYYWRVIASNSGGSSEWSGIWNFTTGIVEPSEHLYNLIKIYNFEENAEFQYLSISPDNQKLSICYYKGGTIYLSCFDISDKENPNSLWKVPVPAGGSFQHTFSHDGSYILNSYHNSGTLRAYNVSNGNEAYSVGGMSQPTSVVAVGNRAYVISKYGNIGIVDLDNWSLLTNFNPTLNHGSKIVVGPNSDYLYYTGPIGEHNTQPTLTKLQILGSSPYLSEVLIEQPGSLAFNHVEVDDEFVYVSHTDLNTSMLGFSKHRQSDLSNVYTVSLEEGISGYMKITPDNKYLFARGTNALNVFDVDYGNKVDILKIKANCPKFTGDGQYLYVGANVGSDIHKLYIYRKGAPVMPPEAPALSSPSNGATGISTSPTLSWNSSSGATSYTLQVSQDSIFSSYVFNQNEGNITSKQITGLSEGTTYYWRVKASNSGGSSEWSSIWNFTTATEISPNILFHDDFEDASIDASKWVQVSGSGTVTESDGYLKLNYRSGSPPHAQIRTAYDFLQDNVVITVKMKPVYIATNKNMAFWIGDINTGSVTGYAFEFHSTSLYCLQVKRYLNYDGWSGASEPMDGSQYKEFSNSSEFYSIHEAKIIKQGNTYTFYVDGEQIAEHTDPSTQPTSLYFSLGRSWMEDRSGEYGEVWLDEITVQSVISYLEAPVLSSPPNGASEVSTSPTLSWNSSSGATSYTLQVSQDSIFSSYVYNQNEGNITSKQITGLSEGTTYYWRVRASNYGGSSECSSIWSFTTVSEQCVAPDWNVNPPDYTSTMTMTAQLVVFDTASTDTDDIVGAFVGEECRGVGHPALFPGTGDYVINLTVYSNTSGETIVFKAWDNSSCRIFDVDTTITFIPDADYGTAFSPVILPVRLQEIKIPLNTGWTWFSVNASNDDMTINNVLAGLTPADGDLIKNQTGFSRYYTGYGWWGDLSEISCKEMYMIKLTSQDSLKFIGVECDITPIPLNEGWTWIGYLPQEAMVIGDALQSLTPSEGDLIKNQTGFSTYYSSTGWWGDLNNMLPFDGYKIKMASSDILTYPAAAGGGSIALAKNVNTKETLSISQPSWSVNPAAYANTMTMTAQLSVNGEISTDAGDLAGVFVGDECRGIGQPIYFPGNGTYVITLTIYSNISGETLTFKAWDNSAGQMTDINETYVFQPDAIVGTAPSPFVLTSTATKIEQDLGLPKEFRLYDNYPNPFNPETAIMYQIPKLSFVDIRIYNIMGKVIRTLVNTQKDPGVYSIKWDGNNEFGQTVSSGMYIYRMQAGEFTAVKKMLFIK